MSKQTPIQQRVHHRETSRESLLGRGTFPFLNATLKANNTAVTDSTTVIVLRHRIQNSVASVRMRSRFLRRPCRSVGRPWFVVEDVETGYPKKGFKIDVGDSERIEMRAGLGASTVGMSVIVNSGTSKGCGSSGRIGSSSSANEGRFPP